jgi:M6 family metalloprotease-like protein
MHKMRKIILTAIFLISSVFIFLPVHTIHAAPLYDMPIIVTQPDGTSLQLFASGDEFYNWLHDKAGYTVVRDPSTEYYVYADLLDGQLVPTGLVPGHDDPKAAGLVPGLNISLAQVDALRAAQMDEMSAQAEEVSPAPSSGTLTNLVIFIRFDGESEFTNTLSYFNGFFNNSTAGANSVRNYFLDVSFNALTIDSTYFPTPGAAVISYRDSHPRAYFQPYDATNPIGYMANQRLDRENALLRDAIAYVNSLGQFPAGTIIDADNDGKVDGVTAVIKGAGGGFAELLWPHSSVLSNYAVNINGKTVTNYTLQLADWMVTSTLSHDFFHVLGAPDLYHFTFDTIHPVGGWKPTPIHPSTWVAT